MYQRVITPIRKELVNAYNKPTYNILETFLAPLDLSTFPTTFGPEDEDPFHPIRVHTKKIDSKELLRNIVAGPEVEARLKDAVRAARRHERFSVLQRLNGTISRCTSLVELTSPSTAFRSIDRGRAQLWADEAAEHQRVTRFE